MSDTDHVAAILAARLSSLSEEERLALNADQIAESERQHTAFHEAFVQGRCSICNVGLDVFNEKKPCLHWFLRPAGVKKKHYPAVAKLYGMMSIQAWMRWVANEGGWAKNIADTADEDHVVQVTARYGDFEWSISCGKTDFAGHAGKESSFPHYHLQMSINGRPFISYNDFHFRIHDNELTILKAMEAAGVKSKFVYGESFDDLMAAVEPEWVIDLPIEHGGDPDSAPFSMDTLIFADEGTTMRGEDIYDMIEKAKRDGVSFASRAHTIPNSSAKTIISEGPGVVDPAPREGGRGSKRREP
jgi:hypothetical protein